MDYGDLVALALPAVISALVAVLASTFRTHRRLRNEIEQESAISERLAPGARQFRQELQRRTLLLTALNRYPPFTRTDAVSLAGMLASVGYGALFILALYADRAITDLYVIVFVPFVTIAPFIRCWTWLAFPWSWRAARRIEFIDAQIGREDARESAFMVRIGLNLIRIGGSAAFCALVSTMVYATLDFYKVSSGVQVLSTVAVALVAFPAGHALASVDKRLVHDIHTLFALSYSEPGHEIDPAAPLGRPVTMLPNARPSRERSPRRRSRRDLNA